MLILAIIGIQSAVAVKAIHAKPNLSDKKCASENGVFFSRHQFAGKAPEERLDPLSITKMDPVTGKAWLFFYSGDLQKADEILRYENLNNSRKIMIARIQEKRNYPYNAIGAYQSLRIKDSSDLRKMAFVYGKLALLYLRTGQYSKAIQMAKSYLPFACAKFSIVQQIILAYSFRGNFVEALNFLSDLQAKDTNGLLRKLVMDYFTAYVYFLQQNYAQTISLIPNLALFENTSEHFQISALLLKAEAFYRIGDKLASRSILEQVNATKPNVALAHFLLAERCYELNDTPCFKTHLDIARKLRPEDPPTTFLWARSILAQKKSVQNQQSETLEIPTALTKQLRFLHLSYPGNEHQTYLIAYYLEAFDFPEDAEKVYVYARDNYGGILAHHSLAKFYLRQRKMREAELVYLQTLERWPFDSEGTAQLVSIYIQLQEKEVAQKYWHLYNRYTVNPNLSQSLKEKIEKL